MNEPKFEQLKEKMAEHKDFSSIELAKLEEIDQDLFNIQKKLTEAETEIAANSGTNNAKYMAELYARITTIRQDLGKRLVIPLEQKLSSDKNEEKNDYVKFPLLKDSNNAQLLDWLYQERRDLSRSDAWRPEILANIKQEQAATLRELRRRIERGAVADISVEVLNELKRVYPELLIM